MSKFVSTENVMVVSTVRTIRSLIDTSLPNGAIISVVPDPQAPYYIEIVVGAEYNDKNACLFTKGSLSELIQELTAIHSAMEN